MNLIIRFAIFIYISGMIFGQSFSLPEEKWLGHVGSLKFSEVDWEPLSYASDYPSYNGLIADYLEILSQKSGIEMVFVQSKTWQEVLDKFKDKEIDLIPAISMHDSVGAEVLYSDPFISFPLVIVTRPEIDFITDTAELYSWRVGVGEGYTSHNFIKTKYPGIDLTTTDNVSDGLKLLEQEKIDAFVGHLAVVSYAINRYNFDLHIAGKTEYVFEHRLGLPADHEHTVRLFNMIIESITPEEHNRIYNRWIKMNTAGIDYRIVKRILTVAFSVVLLIVLWNRRISSKKKEIEQLLKSLQTVTNQLEDKNRVLKKLVITDRLTGLNNRVKLDEVLRCREALYNRYKQQYGVILLDIDHFKMINDSYGHLTGDMILKEISSLLKSHLRKTDTIGRWGGEEFLIICPETNRESTGKIAEKLRKEIDIYNFPEGHKITASFGVSAHKEKDDVIQLLKRADEALYEAKNTGRNQVISF